MKSTILGIIVVVAVVVVAVGAYFATLPASPVTTTPKPTSTPSPTTTTSPLVLNGQEAKIGFLLPVTGWNSYAGSAGKNGVTLAVDEINARGGILGAKIVPFIEDYQSDTTKAASAVEKLITQNNVVALLGPLDSGSMFTTSAISENYAVPNIASVASADSLLQRGYKYYFSISPTDTEASVEAARFVTTIVGNNLKIAIIYEDAFFPKSRATSLNTHLTNAGHSIVFYESWVTPILDFTPLLLKLKGYTFDLLYFVNATEPDAVLLMRQIREQNINAKLMVGSAAVNLPEFGVDAGKNATYLIADSQWNKDAKFSGPAELGGSAIDFNNRYFNKYGKDAVYQAGGYYAAVYVLANAIERAKSLDKEAITKALRETKITNSVYGPISFNENGKNVTTHSLLLQWQQIGDTQSLVTVWPDQYASQKIAYPVPLWTSR